MTCEILSWELDVRGRLKRSAPGGESRQVQFEKLTVAGDRYEVLRNDGHAVYDRR
jgi:hypothetical protein